MRAGSGCTVQQALTNDAANVVKQAVILARRRGHAQVTPLHVANTMLSSSTGLLRTACIQSHSHPLQCRALELCFNVALNRLPASSTPNPMLGGHHHHSQQYPSISNALVAAFKRAQAHQRRGSIENQQQPLLAVKIELEQLIISILDDPSVSRVMREAGFNSTQVKSKVEQVVSLEICSPNSVINSSKSKETSNSNNCNLILSQSPISVAKPRGISDPVIIRNDDVMYVMENLMRKNFVVVGECVSSIEGLVRAVIEKVDKGDVPACLKDVKFVDFSFSSFGHLNRVEVEQKLEEVKGNVMRRCLGNGIVLNLGDIKWAIEYRASSSEQGRGYYCPVEHMIMELGKLVCNIGENSGKFRIMGIATFQTYMRCKSGNPSLENVWGLHPLTISEPSLRLSLITDHSDLHSQSTSKKVENGSSLNLVDIGARDQEKQLTCCADCSTKFQNEVRILQSSNSDQSTTSSNLPPWFQSYKDNNNNNIDNNKRLGSNDKDSASVRELCKKWNSFCNSVHKQPHYSSVSPPSSTSCSSVHFLRSYIPELSNPNNSSTPNSASSSDIVMENMEYVHKFKELNAENLTTLCTALEKKVPWQKDIIPEIVSTILKCRSGMLRRKGDQYQSKKEETWLFFQGVDFRAKEKIAKVLAKLVFGSVQENFVTIALSSFSSSTRADSTDVVVEDSRINKRLRDETSCCSYIERFAEAVSSNPHRVFFIEDVEQADYCSQMGFKRAIERGRIISNNGDEEAVLSDAIVILSCESFSSRSRACSPPITKQKSDGSDQEEKVAASLDLNISIDDDCVEEEQSIDDIGLLESVDRRIIFNFQEL